jgi:hypothetical protein
MKFLDELEALCKSSYSQSFVSIEIHELLHLISIARAVEKCHHEGYLLPLPVQDALVELNELKNEEPPKR